jgi:hypothetical protein
MESVDPRGTLKGRLSEKLKELYPDPSPSPTETEGILNIAAPFLEDCTVSSVTGQNGSSLFSSQVMSSSSTLVEHEGYWLTLDSYLRMVIREEMGRTIDPKVRI